MLTYDDVALKFYTAAEFKQGHDIMAYVADVTVTNTNGDFWLLYRWLSDRPITIATTATSFSVEAGGVVKSTNLTNNTFSVSSCVSYRSSLSQAVVWPVPDFDQTPALVQRYRGIQYSFGGQPWTAKQMTYIDG